MNISRCIKSNHERLSSGLSEALALCRELKSSSDACDIIELDDKSFITPSFVVPLAVYIINSQKDIRFRNPSEYMNLICLNSLGVDAGRMRSLEFDNFLSRYALKSYIPLVCFPTTNDKVEEKNRIISTLESLIIRQTNLESNIISGLKYMLGEVIDNITEHSGAGKGYIIAQSYPQHQYIDICVGDTGITLLGSYKNNPRGIEICSDCEAMRAANSGVSTKNRPEAENRGYGIRTSKRMLVEGLGGQYLMVSGDTVYIKTPLNEGYIELPNNIRFEGTIISCRIPYNVKSNFSYIQYIE